MKLAVAGAGAVGCHYGSMLQQAGGEVVFLARGAHLAAMRQAIAEYTRQQGGVVVFEAWE